MQVSPALHQILYLSRLAPGCEYDTFVSLCRALRARHEAAGCAGALLFDGHRICHLMQGPSATVRSLLEELAADTRHQIPTLLADGVTDGPPVRPVLAAGYCDVDALDVFDMPQALRGDAALAAFSEVLSHADLSP